MALHKTAVAFLYVGAEFGVFQLGEIYFFLDAVNMVREDPDFIELGPRPAPPIRLSKLDKAYYGIQEER